VDAMIVWRQLETHDSQYGWTIVDGMDRGLSTMVGKMQPRLNDMDMSDAHTERWKLDIPITTFDIT
jgi:hypothetical protein